MFSLSECSMGRICWRLFCNKKKSFDARHEDSFSSCQKLVSTNFFFKVKIEHFRPNFTSFCDVLKGCAAYLTGPKTAFCTFIFIGIKLISKHFRSSSACWKNTTKKSDVFAWKGPNFYFFENLFIKSGFGANYFWLLENPPYLSESICLGFSFDQSTENVFILQNLLWNSQKLRFFLRF